MLITTSCCFAGSSPLRHSSHSFAPLWGIFVCGPCRVPLRTNYYTIVDFALSLKLFLPLVNGSFRDVTAGRKHIYRSSIKVIIQAQNHSCKIMCIARLLAKEILY